MNNLTYCFKSGVFFGGSMLQINGERDGKVIWHIVLNETRESLNRKYSIHIHKSPSGPGYYAEIRQRHLLFGFIPLGFTNHTVPGRFLSYADARKAAVTRLCELLIDRDQEPEPKNDPEPETFRL